MGELRRVRVLLCVGVGDGLVKSTPHGYMVGEVGCQPAVKVCRAGLEVGSQSSVLEREVIVFLFVHFLVDDILFRHSQGTTGSSFVNL